MYVSIQVVIISSSCLNESQAYLITAVVVGAALGHYIFGSTLNLDAILLDTSGGKGMACH